MGVFQPQVVDCSPKSLSTLPDDVLNMILSGCEIKDILSASSTCSNIKSLPVSKSIYSTFTLNESTSWNDLKVLISHSSDVEILKVDRYSFVEELFLELPNLKTLECNGCEFNSLDFIGITMKNVQEIRLSNCSVKKA
jgi:F-box domain.